MPDKQETVLQGTPVSPGIGIGPVHVVARGFSAPEVYEISEKDVPAEQDRFKAALEETKIQLDELQERIKAISGEEESRIFEAHLMVLEDRAMLGRVAEAISTRRQNAEFAFYAVMQHFLEAMRRVPDPYLRERTADLEDVCQRVLRNFREEEVPRHAEPDEQHILVAYDLTPSDTAAINRRHVLGFATELGSVNSHTAILARSLGLPAIVGVEDAVLDIRTLTPAILDGYSGRLILHPSEETLARYRELQDRKEQVRRDLEAQRDEDTTTTDGRAITLSSNIEFLDEIAFVQKSGAKGVGLYRTEFLLLDGEEMPGELEQSEAYTRLAKALAPHPVIIRTLDAGGDKLPVEPLTEPEPNPFLGWRGIRVSLDRPGMFKEQLRAILRASAHGKLAVMFPLVSGLGEVRRAKAYLRECMDELSSQGVPFDEKLETGVMIEVPSAAVIADLIAPEVDFFSIGTNDLIQYTVAVDRVNHHVAELYRPTHPAVVRLIKQTVDAAANAGIWTGVCGEMAGDIRLTPLMLGLGVQELSVGPHQVPRVRRAIRALSHAECVEMANLALKTALSPEIMNATVGLARKYYPELLD
ncbi:phosphoenolpyruvate--protein phosphotransferase [Luteolibacter arcticus]|uniref:Phosphoenolpyruvate-protein phosphotransferase n=1 Tax=Luteolibacter arcticus TaxID=1581411 RepID=A0ABT3GMS0_9BACT|nr:phosphoenolpyruvate--protein phosphotransferase [Luteolibacter arcticus]MCW1924808.1 phosphoenolpyruvate--protein phosphotransferase [Luteolibacter arcticus]